MSKLPVDFMEPGIKKVSAHDRGTFFAPTQMSQEELEAEFVKDEFSPAKSKVKKYIKVCVAVVGLIAMIAIGLLIVKDEQEGKRWRPPRLEYILIN